MTAISDKMADASHEVADVSHEIINVELLKLYIMGFIIFLVLCLNVIGYMCGGNGGWGE